MSNINELDINLTKFAKEIWINEFNNADIPIPNLQLHFAEEIKIFAKRILLSCYLPSSLISENENEEIEEYFYYPINLYNHFKLSLKNILPRYFNNLINIKNKKIPIKKKILIQKIGVHPTYFDIEHPLSKIYYVK